MDRQLDTRSKKSLVKTNQKVAIKKINNVFEHTTDAIRILREIKLMRLLKHHPEFKDIYVVFELMDSDLHQVIKANNDLTPDHHKFCLALLLLSPWSM